MRFITALLLFLASALAQETFKAHVDRVIDGDTIVVITTGHIYKVRLFGIDAPEKNQDEGTAAMWFTTDKALGRTVTVMARDTDRYGRLVADIILSTAQTSTTSL